MESNGFTLDIHDTNDLGAIKTQYQVPSEIQSCHTAIVDGYVLEGHVPVAEVARLLDEKPDIIGLAVPGMPIGSPGMEVAGSPSQPYNVIAFDTSGNLAIYASYNQ